MAEIGKKNKKKELLSPRFCTFFCPTATK